MIFDENWNPDEVYLLILHRKGRLDIIVAVQVPFQIHYQHHSTQVHWKSVLGAIYIIICKGVMVISSQLFIHFFYHLWICFLRAGRWCISNFKCLPLKCVWQWPFDCSDKLVLYSVASFASDTRQVTFILLQSFISNSCVNPHWFVKHFSAYANYQLDKSHHCHAICASLAFCLSILPRYYYAF